MPPFSVDDANDDANEEWKNFFFFGEGDPVCAAPSGAVSYGANSMVLLESSDFNVDGPGDYLI